MIKAGEILSVEIHSHSELTIRRPDGTVETVRRPEKMGASLFAKIKAATKAAGRGDVLSYVNITKTASYTVTAADEMDARSERQARMMRYGE